MRKFIQENYFIMLLVAVFMCGIFMRPALPVDETRYLTVAWEMWFKRDWVNLSYNFEPYHHKPPMMFWLMNMFWAVFGISRWAATLPNVISAVLVVILTGRLALKLFPEEKNIKQKVRLLMLGSLPLLLYGSLIMFDVMLTVFVLAALFCLLAYGERRSMAAILGFGLCMGLGVLTKGPVIYVYTLLPALFGPVWIPAAGNRRWVSWYGGIFASLLISLAPAIMWVSAMLHADEDFLQWLLWKQTAGRVTGSFSNAHSRSFFFYIPVLPLLMLPWLFFPSLWSGIRARKSELTSWPGIKFLACWALPAFLAFCLISGKQPHYLVPLFPAVIIALGFFMQNASLGALKKTVLSMFAFFIVAHVVSMKFFFPLYDWRPIAEFVGTHQQQPWAYVRNYNGEIGFLGRLEHPLTSTNLKNLPAWFKENPDGYAVIRYKRPEEVKDFELLFAIPYRVNHYAGIFKAKR